MAYCGLAHTPYPPHFEQQEGRATTDNKHVSTFGWYQAVTATALNKGASGERVQLRLE